MKKKLERRKEKKLLAAMKRSDVFLKCTQNLISRWITNKLLISLRCVSYKKAYKYGILFYFVLFYFILFEWMWGSADRRGVWVALRKLKLLFVISYVKLVCYLIWICNKYSNPSALRCVSYCCRCWGWQEVLLLRTRQSSLSFCSPAETARQETGRDLQSHLMNLKLALRNPSSHWEWCMWMLLTSAEHQPQNKTLFTSNSIIIIFIRIYLILIHLQLSPIAANRVYPFLFFLLLFNPFICWMVVKT